MDIDRRGLVVIAFTLFFAVLAVAWAGYVGSQARQLNQRPLAIASRNPFGSASPSAAPAASASPSPSPSPTGPPRTIAFLGDGWTLGNGAACGAQCSFAALTASQLGMTYAADAVAGTGYANGGGTSVPGPDPFSSRAGHFEGLKPDIAVIAGGQNDSTWVQSTLLNAATSLLTKLKQDLAHSSLVVVGPFSASGQPSSNLLATRDTIAAAAKSAGLPFIDPIAEQWITTANAGQYIAADSANPNVDGHKYLADRLVAALRQLKIA